MLLIGLMLGSEHQDHKLVNAVLICLFDVLMELFDIVPNWRRRQFLLLDGFVKLIYGESELWYDEVRKTAFTREKLQKKENVLEDIYEEFMMVREYYGSEVIELHLNPLRIRQRQQDKNQFLRLLVQQKKCINVDKAKLGYYYIFKMCLVLYWLFGSQSMLSIVGSALGYILQFRFEMTGNFIKFTKDQILCSPEEMEMPESETIDEVILEAPFVFDQAPADEWTPWQHFYTTCLITVLAIFGCFLVCFNIFTYNPNPKEIHIPGLDEDSKERKEKKE